MSPVKIIINRGSGKDEDADERKAELEKLFGEHDLKAEVLIADGGEQLMKFAEEAAESDAEIIVAGGGDGTISAVASKICRTKKLFGVLPFGTLNHFSKDLNIPPELADAVKVIAEKNVKKIDIGEINGTMFINNSSIGLYPEIVKDREDQQESLGRGKWSAAFWALVKIMRRHPFLTVKLKNESGERTIKTPFVFVGNGAYEMDFFSIGEREEISDGKLSVYFLHKSGRKGLFFLFLRTVFGRLRQAEDFEEISVEDITIETRKDKMLVAFDGEVDDMKTPLCYCIHPNALKVIVPRDNEKG